MRIALHSTHDRWSIGIPKTFREPEWVSYRGLRTLVGLSVSVWLLLLLGIGGRCFVGDLEKGLPELRDAGGDEGQDVGLEGDNSGVKVGFVV